MKPLSPIYSTKFGITIDRYTAVTAENLCSISCDGFNFPLLFRYALVNAEKTVSFCIVFAVHAKPSGKSESQKLPLPAFVSLAAVIVLSTATRQQLSRGASV